MLLNLPFAYRASVLPSTRHRLFHDCWVRGYTDVLIPEISQDDVTPAIELRDAVDEPSRTTMLVSQGGRLFRPVRSLLGRSELTPEAFEKEVAKRGHQLADFPEPDSEKIDFDHRLFPTVSIRWNVAYLDQDAYGPLSWPTLAVRGKAEGWPAPVAKFSSEEAERAWAQSHYPKAFLMIDGVLHAECPEPVWHVKSYGLPRPSVVLEQFPTVEGSDIYFRLDQPDRALSFARSIGGSGRSTTSMREMVLIEAAVVERIDPYHIALSTMRPLRRRRIPDLFRHCADGLCGDAKAIFEKVEKDGFQVRLCDVPALLDAVEVTMHIATERGWYDHERGDWHHLQDVAARWKFEKEAGLDMTVFDELSPDDLAALEGWEFE